MKEKIQIKDLHKSSDLKVVLDGIDLTVHEPEILSTSDAGKSAGLKNLAGIMQSGSDHNSVNGVEFTGADADTRRGVLSKYGILFQSAALFDSLNIHDTISFGLVKKNKPEDRMRKRTGFAPSIARRPTIMLYEGKIIYTESPDEFKGTSNLYVRHFIGGRAHGPIQVL